MNPHQEQRDTIAEMTAQIFELVMRINQETELACFLSVSGHVSGMDITVAESKENFLKKVTKHEVSYWNGYTDDNGFNSFLESAKCAIDDLNGLLSKKWSTTFKAYCNLIDMSCSQVFTSEQAANLWCRKMKRKYNKVGAIIGVNREQVAS